MECRTILGSQDSQSIQSLSRVRLFETPWTAARQASLSITNSRSLLKLMSIESVMPCNHLILCHPLLLLPSIFSRIKVFSNESALHIRWTKYWSFIFSINPSNEYSGFISFRIDWLGLLAVQGTVKIILQHHNSKATTVYNLDYFWRLSPLTKSRLFFHYNIFLILEYVHYPICYIAYVGEENFSSTFLNSLAS